MAEARLKTGVKVGYGMAEMGLYAFELILRITLLKFYTDVAGLGAGLAGVAMAIGMLWDAISDPLMGNLSDRTVKTAWDRRRWVLVGGLFLGGSFVLLFLPPATHNQQVLFGWLTLTICLVNTGYTIVSVPYLAMGSEMTRSRYERSVIFGYRFAFGNIGSIMAASLPVVFLSFTKAEATNLSVMDQVGFAIALTIVLGTLICWFSTARVDFSEVEPPPTSLRANLRCAWRNPTFLPLLAAFIVATLGIAVNAVVALYYYDYRLGLSSDQQQYLLVGFMVFWTLSLAVWVKLSKRFGKVRPLAWGAFLIGVLSSFSYPFLAPGSFWGAFLVGGAGLGSLAGSIVLMDSILTDVINYDSFRFGGSRAGIYFGFWRFGSKLARGGAILVTGYLLDLMGFVPNHPQEPAVSLVIALLIGPGVGIFFLISAFILMRYRYSDRKQQQVQRILDHREARLLKAQAEVAREFPGRLGTARS